MGILIEKPKGTYVSGAVLVYAWEANESALQTFDSEYNVRTRLMRFNDKFWIGFFRRDSDELESDVRAYMDSFCTQARLKIPQIHGIYTFCTDRTDVNREFLVDFIQATLMNRAPIGTFEGVRFNPV
jgi:hypothetical protein